MNSRIMPNISHVSYGPADFSFVRREKYSPSYFSHYKKFFRGAKWSLFLEPACDINKSLDNARRFFVNEGLWEVPAVYEFAVSKTPGGKRYKTYIGTTSNLKKRQDQYLHNGSHIRDFLENAIKSGLYVMRRVRYIIPSKIIPNNKKELAAVIAEQTETRFLGKYNYSWNSRQNGNKAMTRMPVKTSFLCFFTRIKWLNHVEAEKFQ